MSQAVKLISFPLSDGIAAVEARVQTALEQGWIILSTAFVPSSDGPGAFVALCLRDPDYSASLARKAPPEAPPTHFADTHESASVTEILPDPEIVRGGNGAAEHDTAADSEGRF